MTFAQTTHPQPRTARLVDAEAWPASTVHTTDDVVVAAVAYGSELGSLRRQIEAPADCLARRMTQQVGILVDAEHPCPTDELMLGHRLEPLHMHMRAVADVPNAQPSRVHA